MERTQGFKLLILRASIKNADDFIAQRPGVHGRFTPPGCQLRDTTAFLPTFVD
jgi:hypothetical protein